MYWCLDCRRLFEEPQRDEGGSCSFSTCPYCGGDYVWASQLDSWHGSVRTEAMAYLDSIIHKNNYCLEREYEEENDKDGRKG